MNSQARTCRRCTAGLLTGAGALELLLGWLVIVATDVVGHQVGEAVTTRLNDEDAHLRRSLRERQEVGG